MVRLDGSFSGEINSSDTLVVGETGVIDGHIRVGALILSGRFKGTISATTLVELRAPAQVEGSIQTPLLKIEEKVIFNGDIKMGSPGGTPAAEKESSAKKI
jgi:cytoskeletal protein CcmA (bactofilin family)